MLPIVTHINTIIANTIIAILIKIVTKATGDNMIIINISNGVILLLSHHSTSYLMCCLLRLIRRVCAYVLSLWLCLYALYHSQPPWQPKWRFWQPLHIRVLILSPSFLGKIKAPQWVLIIYFFSMAYIDN